MWQSIVKFQDGIRNGVNKFLGTTGTILMSGILSDSDIEDNTAWTPDQSDETVRKMIRSDPVIRASLLSIKLPIQGAAWRIEPASDDNVDIKIAETVEANLADNPFMTYQDFIRDLLRYLEFGFAVFEKVYIPTETEFGPKLFWNMQYLKPETIEYFHVDTNSQLETIEQMGYTPGGGKYITPKIPIEKILHISYDQEGHYYRGRSLLRSAYRSWKMKDHMLKVAAIRAERWGAGIPKGKLLGTGSESDLRAALKDLRANEQGYVIQTKGYEIELMNMSGNAGLNLKEEIMFHNDEINSNILRDFMSLGKSGVGSFALGKTDADFFMLSLDSVANHVEDILNEGKERMNHIKQFVNMNFPNVKKYPKFRIERIRLSNMTMIADALQKLSGIYPGLTGEQEEDFVREILGLPEREKDAPQVQKIDKGMSYQLQEQKNRWRQLTKLEATVLDIDGIDNKIRKVQYELKETTRNYYNEITRSLIDRGVKIILKAKDVKELQQLIEKTMIPMTGQLENSIVRTGKDLFQYGRREVKKELAKQGANKLQINPPAVESIKEAEKAIRPTAKASIINFTTKIKAEFSDAIMTMFKAGSVNSDLLTERLNRVSKNVFNKEILKIANESFGMGRNAELLQQKVPQMIRSEIFDDATCDPCIDIDGMEFTQDDPFFSQVSNGAYVNCKGAELCRGINIGVV